jgi:cyclopropane-fatty-acyl-phospholipid synthase
MLKKKLMQWASNIRQQADVHARFVLWDGQQLDLGNFSAPRVTVYIKEMAAIPYLLGASMSKLGEAYVKGKIDIEGKLGDIIQLGFTLVRHTPSDSRKLQRLARYFTHTRHSDMQAIQFHYDLSNVFYQLWLDRNMVYSCAYFAQGDEDLETAQLNKIDHILTKLQLKPGETLLDIGCGWGALVIRAAEKFGARCVGVTLSQNQFELATERVKTAGLSGQVEIRLQDYRDVSGRFDKIASVGMFEHVGRKQLVPYFRRIHDLLNEGGLAMNHGITATRVDEADANFGASEFIDKYVFPNGELPHVSNAIAAMQEGGLEVFDVENLRRHYARTLSMWADNFEHHAAEIQQLIDAERYRVWRLYLAGCAYSFQHDQLAIYQVLCQRAGKEAHSLPWSRRYMYPSQ